MLIKPSSTSKWQAGTTKKKKGETLKGPGFGSMPLLRSKILIIPKTTLKNHKLICKLPIDMKK